jgi:hypothetical protein
LNNYGTQVNVRKGMLVLVDKVVFHPQLHTGFHPADHNQQRANISGS